MQDNKSTSTLQEPICKPAEDWETVPAPFLTAYSTAACPWQSIGSHAAKMTTRRETTGNRISEKMDGWRCISQTSVNRESYAPREDRPHVVPPAYRNFEPGSRSGRLIPLRRSLPRCCLRSSRSPRDLAVWRVQLGKPPDAASRTRSRQSLRRGPPVRPTRDHGLAQATREHGSRESHDSILPRGALST